MVRCNYGKYSLWRQCSPCHSLGSAGSWPEQGINAVLPSALPCKDGCPSKGGGGVTWVSMLVWGRVAAGVRQLHHPD